MLGLTSRQWVSQVEWKTVERLFSVLAKQNVRNVQKFVLLVSQSVAFQFES
jgi:hypothetical protein